MTRATLERHQVLVYLAAVVVVFQSLVELVGMAAYLAVVSRLFPVHGVDG